MKAENAVEGAVRQGSLRYHSPAQAVPTKNTRSALRRDQVSLLEERKLAVGTVVAQIAAAASNTALTAAAMPSRRIRSMRRSGYLSGDAM